MGKIGRIFLGFKMDNFYTTHYILLLSQIAHKWFFFYACNDLTLNYAFNKPKTLIKLLLCGLKCIFEMPELHIHQILDQSDN